MGFIYKITSPSGRIYVGQTYEIGQRISNYKALRHRSKKSIIIWSIKKYGWAAHSFEVIEEVEDSLMNEREIFWIAELKTFYPQNPHGMNLTFGGGGVRQPWKHDLERVAKAKLRCGDKSPMYGKSLSAEAKDKISKSVSKYNKENGVAPLPICYQILKGKQSIAVLCYDLKGDFIAEYSSITDAAKSLKIDRKTANDNLNGRQSHGGGFIFRKKIDSYPLKINVDNINFHFKKRPIVCIFKEEVVEYLNFSDAAKKMGMKEATIKDAFYSKKPLRSGHVFKYKDEYKLVS